jgi:hypothetical protein
MVFYHKGLQVRKTPLFFVACDWKAAILRVQIWPSHESDVVGITTSYQHLHHFRYSQDYVKKEFCDSALLSQNNTFGLHWGVGY